MAIKIKLTIEFNKIKTTKHDFEDAACQNCNSDLWEVNKKQYAYIWEGQNAYLQLCEDCFNNNVK